ncbi:MAG: hypothetical protein KAI66_00760 [Lentisphaeria bacterium]|nr:hypothetical protein [Lentisphaeria bacterium]
MPDLIEKLSSFDASTRLETLRTLAASQPTPSGAETDWLNMHLHTFFSYNGEGWSPARIAWEAREQRLYSIAICDFDVLQGLEELYAATDLLGLRAAVGFESRTFFSEYSTQEINSPGEPGVYYFMGMGFVAAPAGGRAAAVFANMLERSHTRNRALIARINAQLDGPSLDYDADVLPLTPLGNATERHIVRAYHDKALALFDKGTAQFWAETFSLDEAEAEALLADVNKFTDMLRGKLMKSGGLGYVQPDETTFPLLDDVVGMILDARAIPMATWLDGTLEGESDPAAQLECLCAKGIAAVNIIPDRNWNIKDPDEKTVKIRELDRYVAAAKALDLPINVGTELNKPGQRFVDDFAAEPMKRHHAEFLTGAQVMVGHTRLLRYADYSYTDARAAGDYPSRAARNEFFASVGALPGPDADILAKLEGTTSSSAFDYLAKSAKLGSWA